MAETDFRFQSEKLHLTYKTHINHKDFMVFARKKGVLKLYSFVHEEGDVDEEGATPYEHTHVFLWYKKRLDSKDVRFFDFNGIHPNWTTKRSMTWAQHICMKYHLGNKKKKNGKAYYIEPVFIFQEGVDDWKFEEELYDQVAEAPSLREGCMIANIVPKTTGDVLTIQRESQKRKFDTFEKGLSKDMFSKLDPWPKDKFGHDLAIILRGPAGCGKTNWALAQSDKAVKIEDQDELKYLPIGTELIVFDECLFFHSTKKLQVSLTDWAMDRTIRIRHTLAKIPANTRKIFTCNQDEHPFSSPNNTEVLMHEAVRRRVYEMEVDGPADLRP